MKATHSGTCQVCGRTQKLPSGNLSLHGYTTRWGFFNGTCHGAKAQPFELSKDLIEEAILRALTYAEVCRNNAYVARQLKDQKQIWREKVKYKRVGETRTWIQDDLLPAENKRKNKDGSTHTWTTYQWKSERDSEWGSRGKVSLGFNETLEQYIAKHNERRGKYWDNEVDRLERYVVWQRNRIENWKQEPKKLIKIMS